MKAFALELPASSRSLRLPLLLLAALALGLLASGTLLEAVACAAFALALLLFLTVRLPVIVKLAAILVGLSFLQRLLGYLKFSEMRGLNLGNVLLLLTLGYAVWRGIQRGRLYRPTPLDFWIALAAIAIPLGSLFFTIAFRHVRGYTLADELAWFKQWVTPFLYFLLLCQCLERRKEIEQIVPMTLALVGLAVLQGLPEVLEFKSWHQARLDGIVGQPNDYAALIATTAPFLFLALFLPGTKALARLLALIVLGAMAVSLLATYSRAGYAGFGIALAGAAYMSYRGARQPVFAGPALLLLGVCLTPLVVVPELSRSIEERFKIESYRRAKRQSYSQYRLMNQYSGDRLELWQGALSMAREQPILGVGFHAFEREIPKHHARGLYNYPHNQFLGAMAEGGIIWLAAILILFWKLLRFLHQNWRRTLREEDIPGQVICGGALVSFLVMLWISMANDFLNPGPKNTVFWVLMAAAIKYGMLERDGPRDGAKAGDGTGAAAPKTVPEFV